MYIGDEQPAANPLLRTTVFAQNPSSAAPTWYRGEKIAPRTTSSGKFTLNPGTPTSHVGISQEDGEVLNKVNEKTGCGTHFDSMCVFIVLWTQYSCYIQYLSREYEKESECF